MSRARSDAGFSLVEALVALAVFAMAGVALVQLQTQSVRTFAQVETRALADLAAQNRLAEIIAARRRPGVGAREQEVEFAGRRWRLSETIAAAGDGQTLHATVEVRAPGVAAPSARAHAFFPAPEPAL